MSCSVMADNVASNRRFEADVCFASPPKDACLCALYMKRGQAVGEEREGDTGNAADSCGT